MYCLNSWAYSSNIYFLVLQLFHCVKQLPIFTDLRLCKRVKQMKKSNFVVRYSCINSVVTAMIFSIDLSFFSYSCFDFENFETLQITTVSEIFSIAFVGRKWDRFFMNWKIEFFLMKKSILINWVPFFFTLWCGKKNFENINLFVTKPNYTLDSYVDLYRGNSLNKFREFNSSIDSWISFQWYAIFFIY